MYMTVSVLQGNKRILPWKMFVCSEEHTFVFSFFHPFFYSNEPLCFFQVLKKKSMRKCLIQFVLCFGVGVVVKLYEGGG